MVLKSSDIDRQGAELLLLAVSAKALKKGRANNMEKYMVVTRIEGKSGARFFDDREKAEQYRMDCECGVGGYAEVYVREEPTEENDFMDGYVLGWC